MRLKRPILGPVMAAGLIFLPACVLAEEEVSEVLFLKGNAGFLHDKTNSIRLKIGSLLSLKDIVNVHPKSYADLAFQHGWKNYIDSGRSATVRIRQNSQVSLQSIYPVSLLMARGDMIFRVDPPARNAIFEVRTPHAAVHVEEGGTGRVAHRLGKTHVWNYSNSRIYVRRIEEDGSLGRAVIVGLFEKMEIIGDEVPKFPERLPPLEIRALHDLTEGMKRIDRRIGKK